jgi:D-alanine-D-alanine ligase
VGILFGGRSGEHEVSLLSAASVLRAIDRNKFDITPIGITKEGRWLAAADASHLLNGDVSAVARRLRAGDPQATPGAKLLHEGIPTLLAPEPRSTAPNQDQEKTLDVVFPVLHGTFGEDGTIQGLFELAGIAYVGSGVLGSAAGMDKDVMKRLFRDAGLPLVKHVTVLRRRWEEEPKKTRREIERALKYPLFVKPANLGSSVGISKAHDSAELGPAIEEAAKYDGKIIVEQAVGGKRRKAREIECSVLGNDDPKASVCGEVIPAKEFYDYDAKYIDEGSKLLIPAKLSRGQQKQVRQMAVRAFAACDCSGLARVDFLMDPATEKIYLNEVNTMPGFTSISMYPKLWAASGIEYPELIGRLIELGLERHAERKRNRYTKQ